MRRVSWLVGIIVAAGFFLLIPSRAAHAGPPTSVCSPTGSAPPPFYDCTMYETVNPAIRGFSELSDVVPLPAPGAPVPSPLNIALVDNPSLPQTDPTNWSEVIEFTTAGPSSALGSVQQLSNGCSSVPNNDTDISCFPAPAAITQFVTEVQTGTGNDNFDCTHFLVNVQGVPFAIVSACSDARVSEPNPNISEAPIAAMLPIAALGLIAAVGFRRRLTRS